MTGVYCLLTFEPEVIRSGVKWPPPKVQVEARSVHVRSPNGLFVFAP
jgi:hypothetical protein